VAFCTQQRWAAKSWRTSAIDRFDSAPWARLEAWGVRIEKRFPDGSLSHNRPLDNGREFALDTHTLLQWEHADDLQKTYPGFPSEGGGLKETLIFDGVPEFDLYRSQLQLPAGCQLHYQPALTPEEIAEGCVRPEWCVGSFAVYDAIGCKIGHLPAARAETADGEVRWFRLAQEKHHTLGLLIVVPGLVEWLKTLPKSAFPVKVDPTFGCTSIGGSSANLADDTLVANGAYSPAADGNLTKLTFYGTANGPNRYTTAGLHLDSSGPAGLVCDSASTLLPNASAQWFDVSMDAPAAISSGSSYHFSWYCDPDYQGTYYDTGAKTLRYRSQTYSGGSLPDPWGTPANSYTRTYSVYGTYTEASTPSTIALPAMAISL